MNELVKPKISPKKSRKKSKNKYKIELGKVVRTPNKNNSIKLQLYENTNKKLKQQKIDKYFQNKRNKNYKKYYKSPVAKHKYKKPIINNNIVSKNIESISNKPLQQIKFKKFYKIRFKVNQEYYINIKEQLFNPNTIQKEYDHFSKMNSEDIYLCNFINQNIKMNYKDS